jgi:hypothetical protein
MADRQITAAAVVSFSERLEDSAAGFYEALGEMFPTHKSLLLAFVDESRKNKVVLIRTYRETVSDALETGFAFEGLELDEHLVAPVVPEGVGLGAAIQLALDMEARTTAFYMKVAELSRSLLATIPRAFRRVARRRDARRRTLQSIAEHAKNGD